MTNVGRVFVSRGTAPTTSFKEDENYYPEPETDTVVLCPECDINITSYIIIKEDL